MKMVRGNFGYRREFGHQMRMPYKKPFVPRPFFDMTLFEMSFPKDASKKSDDTELTNCLLKRNQDLTASATEQTAISNLVTKVQGILDNLVIAPGDLNTCVQLEEVRQVGSYKKGTMLANHNVADIVVILKTLPTREACEVLSKRVDLELKNAMKTEVITKEDVISMENTDKGFDVFNVNARVRILITTIPANLRRLEPKIHLDGKVIQNHLGAIRHSHWFEENAHHSSIKVLIRILRDIMQRFDGFHSITPWMIDLLAHFAIMNNPTRQALPINVAFRRVFQLLAAGLFLPNSSGILDPCEKNHVRVFTTMTLEQQDVCCMTAQTLLRVLLHGGYKHILGLEGNTSIAREMSIWDGVVVSPTRTVYDKSNEKSEDGNDTNVYECEIEGDEFDESMNSNGDQMHE